MFGECLSCRPSKKKCGNSPLEFLRACFKQSHFADEILGLSVAPVISYFLRIPAVTAVYKMK